MKHRTHIFLLFLVNLFALNVFSQNYPVQVTTILQSPFSGYVQDYSTLGNENLKVLITFQDFTKPSYSIKLKFKLSGQNITIENKNYYFAGPFTIYPGVPVELSGSDLASMLNSNNLEFSGLSRNYYESAKVLPEGNYQICITAFDAYNPNNIQVSNNSCVNAWMMLNDPPFTNIPACGSIVTPLDPQNLLFQWSSMNLASPNSAFSTSYEFSLYEVRPKGANPNNIIQSLPPIYQTTTSLLSLNYGMTEPVLNLGMDYVWRVKAIDNSGRDLFKNNGYSQICTFTYGSMSNFIDTSALRLTLQGTPINYRIIKCFWDTMNVYKSYKLIYKKESGTNWFTTSGITKPYEFIQNLEEENTYKIYMKGILLDNTEGPASNTITITTPKKTDYACGQGLMSPAQNTKPLLAAQLGQVWEVGQFEVTVTHLNNLISSNGIYSGLGNVEIPFLGNFNVSFNNIMVNEQFQVITGQVNVITKGIGRWLNSFNYPPGWNMTDSLRLNTPVSSATVNSSGQIVINGSPVGNTGLNTVITGNDGSTVYVSANGSITIENNPKEAPVGNITQLEDSLAVVHFTTCSKTDYGYDAYDIKTETAGKDYLGLQKGEGVYKVPYKLLVTGTADIVKAKLIPVAVAINTNTIKFKRSDGTILSYTAIGNGDYEIALNGRLNLFADDIWAFAKKANSADTAFYPLGKMALASVDKKVKKAKLIPVNGIGTGVNLQAYTQELNSIYKKTGVEWQLSIDSNLTVNSYDPDSTLMVSRNSLNTTYGTDLRNIINAYKANRTVSEDCSYIFLCNKATNSEMGYMALNKRYGFVFMQNNLQVEHSIAHELGHGALVLEHTFENGDQGPSQNLMDYNGGELFNHAQWLNIHDPKTLENIVNTLVQDEESGSYNANDARTIFDVLANIKKAYTKKTPFITAMLYKPLLIEKTYLQGIQYDYISIRRISDDGLVIPFDNIITQTINIPSSYGGGNIVYISIDNKIKISVPLNRLSNMIHYLKSTVPTKNLIIFSNGYRPIVNMNGDPLSFDEYVNSNNKIETGDSRDYWKGIDAEFMNRIGNRNPVYADGHHAVATSNHLTTSNYIGANAVAEFFKFNCTNGNLTLQDCSVSYYLHRTPNLIGFGVREANGRIAASDLDNKINSGLIQFNKQTDSVDVVAHSMGYAYAVGIIKKLHELGYKFRCFYILAPENACSGNPDWNWFKEAWQYGTNELFTPPFLQDGVAPQCECNDLPFNDYFVRAYIPNDSQPKGFLDSHTIKNYD